MTKQNKMKDEYIFDLNEWDLEKLEYAGVLKDDTYEDVRLTKIRVRKKKPKPKLYWQDITPCKNEEYKTDKLIAAFFTGYLMPDLINQDSWMRHYCLVQFKLDAPGLTTKVESYSKNRIVLDIGGTERRLSAFRSRKSDINASLVLREDCLNSWSAPVVLTKEFYKDLPEYVAILNREIAGEEEIIE